VLQAKEGKQYSDVNNTLHAVADNFNTTLLLFLVENLELTFLLPVIERSDDNLKNRRDFFVFQRQDE